VENNRKTTAQAPNIGDLNLANKVYVQNEILVYSMHTTLFTVYYMLFKNASVCIMKQ